MPTLYQVLPMNNYKYLHCDTSGGTYVHSTTRLMMLVVYNERSGGWRLDAIQVLLENVLSNTFTGNGRIKLSMLG